MKIRDLENKAFFIEREILQLLEQLELFCCSLSKTDREKIHKRITYRRKKIKEIYRKIDKLQQQLQQDVSEMAQYKSLMDTKPPKPPF